MTLFLLRHGQAQPDYMDRTRPLTRKGIRRVVRLAEFVAGNPAFNPSEIWHSPLTRACETANLLAAHLQMSDRTRALEELRPDADPAAIVGRFDAFHEDLLLVGHNPHLRRLIGRLLYPERASEHDPGAVIQVKKGSLIRLERPDCFRAGGGSGPEWLLSWILPPRCLEK